MKPKYVLVWCRPEVARLIAKHVRCKIYLPLTPFNLLRKLMGWPITFKTAGMWKSVLIDEDISVDKNLFVQWCRTVGIPTYVLCHGVLGQKWGFVPLTADKIFVWGRASKAKLESWGVEPDRIIVSGNPLYTKYRPHSIKSAMKNECLNFDSDIPAEEIIGDYLSL